VSANNPRELVHRFYREFDAGDMATATSDFSNDVEIADPGIGTVRGAGPFREYLESFKRALPDGRVIVDREFEAGDALIVEGRFVGTHTGSLTGPNGEVRPTGSSVNLRFANVWRIEGHRITSHHTYYDQLDLLTQLGLMRDA
jgi:ketosteroid isomerase-like protein